jgi:hypothetical protein
MEYSMSKPQILYSLLAILMALSSSALVAENKIYRWVDADGVVHYGERPNAQFNSEEVAVSKAPGYSQQASPAPSTPTSASGGEAGEAPGAQATEPEPSYAQQRRDARAKARKEAAEEKQEMAAKCDLHRQLVAKLEPMPRVIIQREDGTVERMDDNERLAQLKKSKDFVSENCRD